MKKYIIGLLLFICGMVLLYDRADSQGLSACGGAQLYCVTTDGTIHNNGIMVGDEFLVDRSVIQLGSQVPFAGSLVGTTGIEIINALTAAGGCTVCSMGGLEVEPTLINPNTNHPGTLDGIGVDFSVTNSTNTIDEASAIRLSWGTIINAGTITNFSSLLIDPFVSSLPGGITTVWGIRMKGDAAATNLKNNLAGTTIVGQSTTSTVNAPQGSMVYEGTNLAGLTAAPNGTMIYCSDCTFANPCAGAGTGAFAKRLNGAWRCD